MGAAGSDVQTFVGPGFGTLSKQRSLGTAGPAPAVVSQRATLRRELPSIYHETEFAMRFVGALEHVLDPIAATLDALPQHFSPEHAPRSVVDTLAAWLGVEIDEEQELDARRETVRM